MKGYLKDLSAGKKLYIMCWILYAASYIGRYNYSAIIAQLVNDGLFTKSETGFISMIYFFCYGIGQLVNGFLGDKISPFKMIFLGLSFSAVSNLLMTIADSCAAMSVIWGMNGISQSMLWAPLFYIISTIINKEQRQKAVFYISFTVPIGTISAYVISLLLIQFSSWKNVFIVSGTVLLAVACAWILISIEIKKKLVYDNKEYERLKENEEDRSGRMKITIVLSSIIFILIPAMFHGMLRDGVTTWVPTMITEKYETTPSFSLLLTILLPIVNLTGVYACTYLYEKIFHDAVKTAMVFFIFSALPICVLLFIGKINVFIAIIMLALITTSMNAANHMMMTVFPMKYAKAGRAGAVTGMLNSATYMGGALSAYVFGAIADVYSWEATIVFWLMIATVSVGFLAAGCVINKESVT